MSTNNTSSRDVTPRHTLRRLYESEFMAICSRIAASSACPMSVDQVVRLAIAHRPRFYCVSYSYARVRLCRMKRTPDRYPYDPMWEEIASRTDTLARRRGISRDAALAYLLSACRPTRFFLTPGAARSMYFRERRRRRQPAMCAQTQSMP